MKRARLDPLHCNILVIESHNALGLGQLGLTQLRCSRPWVACSLGWSTTVKDPHEERRGSQHPCGLGPPQLTEPGNIALPVSYLLCGFLPALIANPTTVFMVDMLDATSAQQNTVAVAYSLPWCFKVGFGFLTDAFPLSRTSRRKPYFVLGFAIHMVANACLARFTSVAQLATCSFFATFGRIMSDVMDAMMVECRSLNLAKCAVLFSQVILGALLARCSARYSVVLYSKQVMPALGLGGRRAVACPIVLLF